MLLLINLTVSIFLTGLIWTIQLVHYPVLLKIEKPTFAADLTEHQKRISPLVAPLMVVELICSIWLLFHFFSSYLLFSIVQLLLVLIIWASTFFIQVPLHQKLVNGYDKPACKQLIYTNWIRTICWSLRALILLFMYV